MSQSILSRITMRKWVFSAMMTAIVLLLSPILSFPLGGARVYPLQHMVNILLAVLAGTKYATSAAFTCSLLRNILGTGSILAFPGSLIGATLSGFLYARTKSLFLATLGEFIGTTILGGLLSYPIATLLLGSQTGAFFYVTLFATSCGVGCVLSYTLLKSMSLLTRFKFNQINKND